VPARGFRSTGATRVAEAPPKPVAPPLPYRIAGQVTHDGAMQVVLARDDRVFTVRQGETLDNIYRIESITPDAVTFVYLPARRATAARGGRIAPGDGDAGRARARQRRGARTDVAGAQAAAGETARRAALKARSSVKAGNDFDVTLEAHLAPAVQALPAAACARDVCAGAAPLTRASAAGVAISRRNPPTASCCRSASGRYTNVTASGVIDSMR